MGLLKAPEIPREGRRFVKLKSPFAINAWSLVTTAVVRQWMGTLDYLSLIHISEPTRPY